MPDTATFPEPTPVAEPIEDRVEDAEKGIKPRRRSGGNAATMTLTVKVRRFNPDAVLDGLGDGRGLGQGGGIGHGLCVGRGA